jgi:hypothetical protein
VEETAMKPLKKHYNKDDWEDDDFSVFDPSRIGDNFFGADKEWVMFTHTTLIWDLATAYKRKWG